MDYKLYVGMGIFVLGFLIYWLFSRKTEEYEIDNQINEILTEDKYKVKGRFE